MLEKYTEKYWSGEIARSEAAQDERGFIRKAEKSVSLFEAAKCQESGSRKLNAWWMIVTTLLPAYYSQRPKVEAVLRKKRGGPLHPLAARIIEGATQYCVDAHFPFDQVATRAVIQLLLTGRASLWARYVANIEPVVYEAAEISPSGVIESMIEGESVSKERAILEVPHYKDYLVSCARDESEIEWRARRAYLDRGTVKTMFGEQFAAKLKYDVSPEGENKRTDGAKYEDKAELWEIWHEGTSKVYWLSSRGEGSLIESGPPPVRYEGFYPCVDVSQNVSLDSVVPVSDFTELEDQLLEIERLTTRIHSVTQAVKVNCAADDTIADKVREIYSSELTVIAVPTTAKKLSEALEFTPIAPYISALEVLVSQRDIALSRLYESTGASDLVRGTNDPRSTATAEELKASFWNARFSLRQRQVHDFFGKAISRLGECIAENFSPETIIDMSNLEEELQNTPPEMVQAALTLLKSPEERCYAIEVVSDSMVALDEKRDRQQRVDLLASAGSFLQQLEPMVTNYPEVGQLGMELLQYTIRSYRGGKELEQTFEQVLKTMVERAQAKTQQAPPLDPAVIQAQARMQEAQINAQLKQQQMMLDSQKLQIDIELKRDELLLKQAEIQFESTKLEAEMARVSAEYQLKSKEIDSKEGQTLLKAQMDAEIETIRQQMESIKVENDRQRVALEMYEKLLEERRLAVEAATRTTPPITVHVDGTKGGRRVGKIVRDVQGNAVGMEMEDM